MRLTVRIEDDIIEGLMNVTKAKNKTQAIVIAISDYLEKQGKKKLLSLKGKMNLEENWKELREEELNEE